MSDDKPRDLIKQMVDNFLSWRLPLNFSPDCGITFKPIGGDNHQWPVGTNLFTADQAQEMIECILPSAYQDLEGKLALAQTQINLQGREFNTFIEQIEQTNKELIESLRDANEMCRSAHSVAVRKGRKTIQMQCKHCGKKFKAKWEVAE